jgi:hypothetical protein
MKPDRTPTPLILLALWWRGRVKSDSALPGRLGAALTAGSTGRALDM